MFSNYTTSKDISQYSILIYIIKFKRVISVFMIEYYTNIFIITITISLL